VARNRVNVNRGALHAVGMNASKKVTTQVTRRTFNRANVLCPVDTGLLRSSGRMSVVPRASAWVGQIEFTAEYALVVHDGRGPVTIRPRRAGGRLRFVVNGKVVYARVVHQPARPGKPFLATAVREIAATSGFGMSVT
jgi:hypothetical protein